jgi:hypothetical protein
MGRRFFALGSPPTRATASNLRASRLAFTARNRSASSAMRRPVAPAGGGDRPARSRALRFRTADPDAAALSREPPRSVDDARLSALAWPVAARDGSRRIHVDARHSVRDAPASTPGRRRANGHQREPTRRGADLPGRAASRAARFSPSVAASATAGLRPKSLGRATAPGVSCQLSPSQPLPQAM